MFPVFFHYVQSAPIINFKAAVRIFIQIICGSSSVQEAEKCRIVFVLYLRFFEFFSAVAAEVRGR
jgi:hypothetical protein